MGLNREHKEGGNDLATGRCFRIQVLGSDCYCDRLERTGRFLLRKLNDWDTG